MIKLFTHNDLDGLSCILLAQLAFGIENVDYDICSYEDINEKFDTYLSEPWDIRYTHCFITDISIREELAQKVSKLLKQASLPLTFTLLDHHISAECLNSYDWCHVLSVDDKGQKTCGTSLFFHHLSTLNNTYPLSLSSLIKAYVEKVRRYDVWDWQSLDDRQSKALNDLLYILGKEKFLSYWYQRLSQDFNTLETFSFEPTHQLLLELKQNEIDKYIESRNEELLTYTVAGYQAGILFANRFQSELGNALALLHPELDFIAMINMGGGVSCRTVKDHVNLAEITALFGGGGHAKAAGFSVPDEIRELVIHTLFHLED